MSAGPFIIGIAGGSGAGKSFLADRLVRHLKSSASIQLDAYYRDLSYLPFSDRTERNFDEPAAIDDARLLADLKDVRSGRAASIPLYDFSKHCRKVGALELPAGLRHVIVEGLFVWHWPGIKACLDLKIYIDTDTALCEMRRKRRDVAERGRTEVDVERQLRETVRPMFKKHVLPLRADADLVLAGVDLDPQIDAVIARLTAREAA